MALRRPGSAGDPGAVSSLGVVASGFALALFLFHLMRIGPARRLVAEAFRTQWCAAIWKIAAKVRFDRHTLNAFPYPIRPAEPPLGEAGDRSEVENGLTFQREFL